MAERPEDLNLPTSIVTKIIKDCLPNTCKVSKEANAAIAKVRIFKKIKSNGIKSPDTGDLGKKFALQIGLYVP